MSRAAWAMLALAALLVAVIATMLHRMQSYVTLGREVPIGPADLALPPEPGDLLLFASSVHCFYNSLILKNLFSHAAVVVGNDARGRPLIVESTREDGSVVLVRMEDRLRGYSGTACLCRRRWPLSEDGQLRLLNAAQALLGVPYPSENTAIVDFVLDAPDGPGRPTHCFQAAERLLGAAEMRPARVGSASSCYAVLGRVPAPAGMADPRAATTHLWPERLPVG